MFNLFYNRIFIKFYSCQKFNSIHQTIFSYFYSCQLNLSYIRHKNRFKNSTNYSSYLSIESSINKKQPKKLVSINSYFIRPKNGSYLHTNYSTQIWSLFSNQFIQPKIRSNIQIIPFISKNYLYTPNYFLNQKLSQINLSIIRLKYKFKNSKNYSSYF